MRGREVVIAPPFTALEAVRPALAGTDIRLAGQNVHWEPKGAYTGEIAVAMLRESGCTHVIVGHSERRQHCGETNETVNRRLHACLGAGLVPIVCVGETLAEREAEATSAVIARQVESALAGVRSEQLASCVDRRLERWLPRMHVSLDVLDHDDCVVDHEAHREHDREQREQVDREAEGQHQHHRADERDRNGHDRDDHAANRSEEKKDDQDHDHQRFGESLQNLIDRFLNVCRGVVRDSAFHPGRQLRLNFRHRFANRLHHVERVRGRQHVDADEDGGLAVEADFLLVRFGAENDVGDVAEAHDCAFVLFHDELLEFIDGLQIRIRDQVDRRHRPLGAAERGEIVVRGECVVRHRGRNAEGGHLVGLEPDAHCEGAVAENLRALHAADGAQLRLHDAHEVVGDLVLIEIARGEAEVRRGELAVRRLQIDDRRFGLGRKLIANLRDFRLNLRQRRIRVVVQFEVDGDRADALRARRFEKVDAVRSGDGALERRGDEAAHEIGVRADIRGRHLHRGNVAARKLPHGQRADRLQSADENDEVDDDRKDWSFDEKVCDFHGYEVPRFRGYEDASPRNPATA